MRQLQTNFAERGERIAHDNPPQRSTPLADQNGKNPQQELSSMPKQLASRRQAGFEEIRRVSDRLLHDQGDVSAALQFYSRALDQASTDQMAVSVDEDSWLLMALKSARMKEKQDEDKNG